MPLRTFGSEIRAISAVRHLGWISTVAISSTDNSTRYGSRQWRAVCVAWPRGTHLDAVVRLCAVPDEKDAKWFDYYDLGRRLYGLLREHGLTDVQAEGRVLLQRAGADAEVARLTVEQLRGDIVKSELATKDEIEAYLALLDDPEFVALSGTLMAVRGRRPAV